MIERLILEIIAGIVGIFAATNIISDVAFNGEIKTLLLVGLTLGLLNFFVKPALKKITLPLRIITFNLFTVIIIMGIVWIVDIIFPAEQFEIKGIEALFWTSVFVWGASFACSFFAPRKRSNFPVD